MPDVPDKYKSLQKEWRAKELVWSLAHYGLGVGAAMLAVAAGLKATPAFLQHFSQSELAFASASVASVLTFLSPSSRRKSYTEACDLLRVARLRYETEPDIPTSALNDAVEKAQNIVARR